MNKGPNSALTGASRAKSSLEIFETDQLLNNLSLSKKALPPEADKHSELDATSAATVKSVKEHAKKLNRLNTQLELSLTPQKVATARKSIGRENRPPQAAARVHVELEAFDTANPDASEKEWILVCSRCEYMDFAKWLSKYPHLAQKKDPFTGVNTPRPVSVATFGVLLNEEGF